MKKLLLTLSTVFLLGLASGISVTPGTSTVIDSNISQNMTVESSSPLNSSINGSGLLVSTELSFPAGQIQQRVDFNNSSKTYDLEVLEKVTWSINDTSVEKSVDLGSSGEFQAFTVNAEGNSNADLSLSTTGDVFEYLQVTDSVRAVPGIGRQVFMTYQVREGAEIGSVNGSVTVEGAGQNQSVDVKLDLQDKIDPEISSVNVSDYMATQSGNFTVQASDNYNISEVTAGVDELVEVNGSEEFQGFQDFRMNSVPNTDKYRVNTGIEAPGTYRVTFTVEDAAGNSVNQTERFTVSELDALQIQNRESMALPPYRSGTRIEKKIGVVRPGTDFEVTLEDFSQDLEEEEWEIAVLSSEEGPQYFNQVNQTVEFSERANLSLVIESEKVTDFNGRLAFDGLQYHKSVEDLVFSGEYLDCPVPQRERFEVLQRNVTLEPVDSDNCEEAGWNIEYFAPASSVPSNSEIKSSINILTPNSLLDQQRTWNNQILSEKDETISFWKWTSFLLLMSSGFMGYVALFAIYQAPHMIHFDIQRSENKITRQLRRAKLGLTER